MHIAKLLSFENHETIIDWCINELHEEPLRGYCPITIQQIERADKMIFQRLATQTRKGLRLEPNGDFPLDRFFDEVRAILTEPKVVNCLNPLQKATKEIAAESSERGEERKWALEEPTWKPKGEGKGKKKGKKTDKPREGWENGTPKRKKENGQPKGGMGERHA